MQLTYTINVKITCIYDSDEETIKSPKKFANTILKPLCDSVGECIDGVVTAEIEDARVFADENN